MKPVLSVDKIREWDAYTIEHEPIASIDLMERAAGNFTHRFVELIQPENPYILVFCSKGNNGGDGLVIARRLIDYGYDVDILIADIQPKASRDFEINLERLEAKRIKAEYLVKDGEMPDFSKYDIIIDALFGSGLSRPITGYWAAVVERLNDEAKEVYAVDIPSGMYADKPVDGVVVICDYCLTFEVPKLSMLVPDNEKYLKKWEAIPIGLDWSFLEQIEIDKYYVEEEDIAAIIKPRRKFDHKGKYGHALIAGGSKGMTGATVLASKACLRSGAGLVTALLPDAGYDIIQTAAPEVMSLSGYGNDILSAVPPLNRFSAICIGPGMGKHKRTKEFLHDMLKEINVPLVLDADALNIIAENKDLMAEVPETTVLTPHPGEFARLFKPVKNGFERIKLAQEEAVKNGVYIILKGAYTGIFTPGGKVYFNSTGNPGMATAGSGDVQAGMITSFLAQGYETVKACQVGVYLHGAAGDIGAGKMTQHALIAGDIIDNIPEAYKRFR